MGFSVLQHLKSIFVDEEKKGIPEAKRSVRTTVITPNFADAFEKRKNISEYRGKGRITFTKKIKPIRKLSSRYKAKEKRDAVRQNLKRKRNAIEPHGPPV